MIINADTISYLGDIHSEDGFSYEIGLTNGCRIILQFTDNSKMLEMYDKIERTMFHIFPILKIDPEDVAEIKG